MCEFISWIEIEKEGKKNVFYLDDKELFCERTSEILKGCKDNDLIGHHAIRDVFGVRSNAGQEHEVQDFWETERLPKEIQAKLHDFASFKKNFGKMVETYAQRDDLEYIVENAPADKKWTGLKLFAKSVLKDLFMRDVRTENLTVNVRHNLSVDELVELNKFGWKDDCMTSKNFPSRKGKAKKEELIVVSMGRDASTKDILKMMKVLKLKAAKPVAFLSLTLDHPNRQKENPLVALGQIWRDSSGSRLVPCAWGFGGKRRLSLSYFGDDWGSDYRFLAVRNS